MNEDSGTTEEDVSNCHILATIIWYIQVPRLRQHQFLLCFELPLHMYIFLSIFNQVCVLKCDAKFENLVIINVRFMH